MNIQQAEQKFCLYLPPLLKENAKLFGDAAQLLAPLGYKMVFEVNSSSKTDSRKLRKKRSSAAIESFDPRLDKLVVSFVPDDPAPDDPGDQQGSDISTVGEPMASPESGLQPMAALDESYHEDRSVDLILALARAESSGRPFVGLKSFRDRYLVQNVKTTWTEDDSARRNLLRILIDRGWIETGKVPNPQSVEFPVTTIQLNRLHPAVCKILARHEVAESSEFRPIKQTGELASRIILKDRR